ncbi:MAG TPA: hypothetical protein VFA10_28235 [Ktedonobacteraceae bacterium]|nr:hypothetical protein [Ktedonobacteraceae bacterium]
MGDKAVSSSINLRNSQTGWLSQGEAEIRSDPVGRETMMDVEVATLQANNAKTASSKGHRQYQSLGMAKRLVLLFVEVVTAQGTASCSDNVARE